MSIIETHRDLADLLRTRVQGAVLTAGDPGYDESRTPFFTHRVGTPAAVVRPRQAGDVAATVDIARETGVPLQVRSGGHSWHSTGEGVLLDLGSLTGLALDPSGGVSAPRGPSSGTVWAGSGLTAGELSEALSPHDLAVGFGDTATVGLGGISLGGGIGFLARRLGLTIDHVLAAEIVTADGRIRLIDARHEPELFWAIRGGGGNFGVVTRFRYRVTELPEVFGGWLVLPASAATLAGLVEICAGADERLTVIANVMGAPPLPGLPPDSVGSPVIAARVCWAGDNGQRAVRPLRRIATPLVDLLGPVPYAALLEEAPDRGQRPAIRTMFLERFDQAVAGSVMDALVAADGVLRVVQIRVLGGAVARIPADGTAYAHRGAPVLVNLVHGSAGADVLTATRWVDELARALDQGYAGAYVNFLGPDQSDRVDAAYPQPTLARLRTIKAAYDPENLFRGNVNITPAGHGAS
jgi:FAD/FMN-containing dehydrogenase